MLVQQIAMMANELDSLLDEWTANTEKTRRRELHEMALLKSIAALDVLRRELLITSQPFYQQSIIQRAGENLYATFEEVRQDQLTLTPFIKAECRLLADLGLTEQAVDPIAMPLRRRSTRASGRPNRSRLRYSVSSKI